jgi:hypothetical protein
LLLASHGIIPIAMCTGRAMLNSRPTKSLEHFLSSIVLVILFLYAASLVGQHTEGPSSPKYDAQTETKIKGTVDNVKLPSSKKEIVYLVMKTGSDTTVEVYLCPKSFLDDMGVTFAKGDEITLTGSKVKQGDADLILAREVVKGTDTLVLRDDKGKPVWS